MHELFITSDHSIGYKASRDPGLTRHPTDTMGCRPSKQARSKIRAVEHRSDFPCLCSSRKLRKSHSHHKCCDAAAAMADYSECGRSSGPATASSRSNPHHHHHHFHPHQHHHHHHRQHGRRSDDTDNEDSGFNCHHSYSTGHRPAYSKSADNTDFPAFSTTTAVYRRSASKTSKITLRLSCDGSTLEIEQCDYDLDRDGSTPSPRPRPWSSAPNLTKLHTDNVGRLFKNANLPLRKRSPDSAGEGWGNRPVDISPSDNSARIADASAVSRKGVTRHVVPVEVNVEVISGNNRHREGTAGTGPNGSHESSKGKDAMQSQGTENVCSFNGKMSSMCSDFSRAQQSTEPVWTPLALQTGVDSTADPAVFQRNADWLAHTRFPTQSHVPCTTSSEAQHRPRQVTAPSTTRAETLDEMMDDLERSLEMTHHISQASRSFARRSKSMVEPTKRHFDARNNCSVEPTTHHFDARGYSMADTPNPQFYARSHSMVEPTKHHFDARGFDTDNSLIAINPSTISQAFATRGSAANDVTSAKTAYVMHTPPSFLNLEPREDRQCINSLNSSTYTDISPDFERIPVHVISSLIKPLPPDSSHPYSRGEGIESFGHPTYTSTVEHTMALVSGPKATLRTHPKGTSCGLSDQEYIENSVSYEELFNCIEDVFMKNPPVRSDILLDTGTENAGEPVTKQVEDSIQCPECDKSNEPPSSYPQGLSEFRCQASDLGSLSSGDSDSVMALVALGCPIEHEDKCTSFMYSGEDKCPLSLFTPEHQISCPFRVGAESKPLCEVASSFHGYTCSSAPQQSTGVDHRDAHLTCEICKPYPCRCSECLDRALNNSDTLGFPHEITGEGEGGSVAAQRGPSVFMEADGMASKSEQEKCAYISNSRRLVSDSGRCTKSDSRVMENMVIRGHTGQSTVVGSINQDESCDEESQGSTKSSEADLYVSVVHKSEPEKSCLEDFSLCHSKEEQDSCDDEAIENTSDHSMSAVSSSCNERVLTDKEIAQNLQKITKKDKSNKKTRKKKRRDEATKSPNPLCEIRTSCTIVTEDHAAAAAAHATLPGTIKHQVSESFGSPEVRKPERVFLSPIVTCSGPGPAWDQHDLDESIPGANDSADYLVELLRQQDNNSLSPSPRWDRHTRFCYDFDYLKAHEPEVMSVSDASDYEISPLYYKKLGDPFLDDELDLFTSMYGVKKAILARNLEASMRDFERIYTTGCVNVSVPVASEGRGSHQGRRSKDRDVSQGMSVEKTQGKKIRLDGDGGGCSRNKKTRHQLRTEQSSSFQSSSSPPSSPSSLSVSSSGSSQEEMSSESFSSTTSSSPSYDSSNFIVFRPAGDNLSGTPGVTTTRESNEMDGGRNKLRIIQAWVLDGNLEVSGLNKDLFTSSEYSCLSKLREECGEAIDEIHIRETSVFQANQVRELNQGEHIGGNKCCGKETQKTDEKGATIKDEMTSQDVQRPQLGQKDELGKVNEKGDGEDGSLCSCKGEQGTEITTSIDQSVFSSSPKKTTQFSQEHTPSPGVNIPESNSLTAFSPSPHTPSSTGVESFPEASSEDPPSALSPPGLTGGNQSLRNVPLTVSGGPEIVCLPSTGHSHPEGQTISDNLYDAGSQKIVPPTTTHVVNVPTRPPQEQERESVATSSHPLLLCDTPKSTAVSVYADRNLPLRPSWDSSATKDQFGTGIDREGKPESCDGSQSLASPPHSGASRVGVPADGSTEHQSNLLVKCYNSQETCKDNTECSRINDTRNSKYGESSGGGNDKSGACIEVYGNVSHSSSNNTSKPKFLNRGSNSATDTSNSNNNCRNYGISDNFSSTANSYNNGNNGNITTSSSSSSSSNSSSSSGNSNSSSSSSSNSSSSSSSSFSADNSSSSSSSNSSKPLGICAGNNCNDILIPREALSGQTNESRGPRCSTAKEVNPHTPITHARENSPLSRSRSLIIRDRTDYPIKKLSDLKVMDGYSVRNDKGGDFTEVMVSPVGGAESSCHRPVNEKSEETDLTSPLDSSEAYGFGFWNRHIITDTPSDNLTIEANLQKFKANERHGNSVNVMGVYSLEGKPSDHSAGFSVNSTKEKEENKTTPLGVCDSAAISAKNDNRAVEVGTVMRVASPDPKVPAAVTGSLAPTAGARAIACFSQGDLSALASASRRSVQNGNEVKVKRKNRGSWPGGHQSKVLSLVSYFEQGSGGK